jgi:hypothetical protein
LPTEKPESNARVHVLTASSAPLENGELHQNGESEDGDPSTKSVIIKVSPVMLSGEAGELSVTVILRDTGWPYTGSLTLGDTDKEIYSFTNTGMALKAVV